MTEEAKTLTYAGYPMLVLVMLVEAETVKAPAAPVVVFWFWWSVGTLYFKF